MTALRAALAIAAKDLRQRLRDRSALILGLGAPLVMVALMNGAFSGVGDFHIRLGVVDADGGPAAEGVTTALSSEGLAAILTVEPYGDADAARQAVDDGDVDAALVLPAGLSAMAAGGPSVPIDVFSTVDEGLAGEVAAGVASSLTARIATARVVAAVATDAGADPGQVPALAAQAAATDPPLSVVEVPMGAEPLEGIAYFGPSMAMFFVLFAVGFTARGFFIERRTGTLDRMVAAPIPASVVLLGKALAVLVYSLASLATMAVATAVLFDASWGPPLGVALLCLAMSASVVALALLVLSLARTERQAESLASVVTFALALAGGSFMFLGSAPSLMRRLAVLTPNGWALRGFTDLATGVDVGAAVTQPLLGIGAFTVVVGALALVVGRGALTR